MVRLLRFLQLLIGYYQIILIIAVIMSWLFASGKISRFDPRMRGIVQALDGMTEPLFRRIRPWLPNTGALDLAPIALWLICIFVSGVVIEEVIDLIGK